jgi:hypothetical protein
LGIDSTYVESEKLLFGSFLPLNVLGNVPSMSFFWNDDYLWYYWRVAKSFLATFSDIGTDGWEVHGVVLLDEGVVVGILHGFVDNSYIFLLFTLTKEDKIKF